MHPRLQSKPIRKKKQPTAAITALHRKHKRLTMNDKRWIVFCRWGTTTPTMDTPVQMTTAQIARKLSIPLSTVGFIISTFLERGYDGYGRTYSKWRMLNPRLQRLLISPQLL